MLKRSRVSSTPDVQRISAAVQRPGIDPRVWQSLAMATSETFVDMDHGIFVNVVLLPTLEPLTARIGSEYAGDGFGFYAPVHKDDMVVVGLNSGDPAEGLVVTKRLWNGADKPPQDAKDNVNDVLLLVEKDKKLRIRVQGSGDVNIIVADGHINLGAADLSDNELVAIAAKVKQEIENLKTTVNNNVIIFNAMTLPSGMGPVGPPPVQMQQHGNVGDVKAKNTRAAT